MNMVLFQLVNLSNQIENGREIMHSLAGQKGLKDPNVLKVSQQLDENIVSYQRLLTLISRQTIYLKEEIQN